ncbi:MAG TPA: cytochrome c3 family protein, partial [Pirellulales bacterium]
MAIAVVALVAIGAALYQGLRPAAEVLAPRGAALHGYVGAAACAECHQDISARQQCSHMALTLQSSEPFAPARSLRLPAVVVDERNRVRYRVERQDGKLQLEAKRGREVARAEMTYALGSGKLAWTFVRELDADNYEELRVTYYTQTDRWDLTPGQRTARPVSAREALGRPIEKHGDQACLNCHASLLVQSAGKVDIARSRFGVDCERCHGPGRDHVESAQQGEPVKLRAPELVEALGLARRLREGQRPANPPEELLQSIAEVGDERLIRDLYVCGECHGRSDIGEQRTDLQLAKLPVAALVASACYQNSATKLLCGDCHDPHGDSPRDDLNYVAVCLRCHQEDATAPAADTASARPG